VQSKADIWARLAAKDICLCLDTLYRITSARDVTIVEKFPEDDESVEEPEYLAQWESESDTDDDSIQMNYISHTKKHTEQVHRNWASFRIPQQHLVPYISI
jgi:hypothetical protein